MRALTLWRPWTDAILYGGKRIENRPWAPWKCIIGQYIALHAGLKYDRQGAMWMLEAGLYTPPPETKSPKGCIVGVAKVDRYFSEQLLFGVMSIPESKNDPGIDDPWFFGPYGWVLSNVVAFEAPVDCKGSQGLWPVKGELLTAVKAEYSRSMKKAIDEAATVQ